ncbi:sugar nucleotide-binding protein, partial [Gammaproteobacteria bacterium]|nr:sugar nucleotide-binding protein [Gammaproteobacteria bacterium]
MRILILGASGMVGYNLYKFLKEYNDIFLSVRDHSLIKNNLFSQAKKVIHYDANDPFSLTVHLKDLKPDVIINAIGVTKQITNLDLANSIYINSYFPHYLNKLGQEYGIRLLTLSTDCIFSGKKGNYTESDNSDAQDSYG